jgi:hypothetical protein
MQEGNGNGRALIERIHLLDGEVQSIGKSLEALTTLTCETVVEMAEIVGILNALVGADRRRRRLTTLQTDSLDAQLERMKKRLTKLGESLEK